MNFSGIDKKVYLYKEYGIMYENQKEYGKAVVSFSEAIRLAMQFQEVEEIKAALSNVLLNKNYFPN